MDLFNSICQALGFALAAGILCGAVLQPRYRLPVAAVLATAVAGVWLRAEDVTFWPMLPIGMIGVFAAGVMGRFFDGVSRRESLQSDRREAAGRSMTLMVAGAGIALLVAAVGYIVAPTAILWLFAIFGLELRRRRTKPAKHEGLRILR